MRGRHERVARAAAWCSGAVEIKGGLWASFAASGCRVSCAGGAFGEEGGGREGCVWMGSEVLLLLLVWGGHAPQLLAGEGQPPPHGCSSGAVWVQDSCCSLAVPLCVCEGVCVLLSLGGLL